VIFDIDTPQDIELRRVLFADINDFQHVENLLKKRSIFYRNVDNPTAIAAGCAAAIEYYVFDEAQIVESCENYQLRSF